MGEGNVQPGLGSGAEEGEVFGTAAAVVDIDDTDVASWVWSRRGHEVNREFLDVSAEGALC